MGAVLANKRPIIACSNVVRTHPKYAYDECHQTIHAEARCVMYNNGTNLKGTTIYVYREHADGSPALARPCNDCYQLLKDFGVKKMIYTIDEYPYFRTELL